MYSSAWQGGVTDGYRIELLPTRSKKAKKILEVLEAERGREPGSLTISVFGQSPDTTRQQVNDFLDAGALRVAAWAPHCETEAKMGEELERMAETMII